MWSSSVGHVFKMSASLHLLLYPQYFLCVSFIFFAHCIWSQQDTSWLNVCQFAHIPLELGIGHIWHALPQNTQTCTETQHTNQKDMKAACWACNNMSHRQKWSTNEPKKIVLRTAAPLKLSNGVKYVTHCFLFRCFWFWVKFGVDPM